MPDFFQTYFVDPIIYNTGYNPVNTVAFAIILVVAVFLVYKLLKKMNITVDRKFFFGILPFVALGGVLRAWEDLLEATGGATNGVFKTFIVVDAAGTARNTLLISPLIYVVMFVIALAALLIAKFVQYKKKIPYWKTWFVIGMILDVFVLAQLRFSSAFAFLAVVGITILWVALTLLAKYVSTQKIKNFLTNENAFLIDIHLFDATTTFVALQFPQQLGINYFEQHVVAGFAIGLLGPASMFLLKLIVVPIVLYMFDKELNKKEDIEKRTFLKIIVLILGMGPGLRNFLRMVMGV